MYLSERLPPEHELSLMLVNTIRKVSYKAAWKLIPGPCLRGRRPYSACTVRDHCAP